MSSNVDIVIRRAKPADAAQLARLRYEFRSSLRPPAESMESFLPRCTAWMQERLATSSWLCWVAESDGAIVGHVWLDIIEKIPNPGPEDELHGYITNAYVQDRLRNQGIGARLLDAALSYCKANRVDSVILWPTQRSRSLYERYGFTRAENVMLAITGANAYKLAQEHRSPPYGRG
jgi:ribosomal protein S18 acetylase RimI-like enzyme